MLNQTFKATTVPVVLSGVDQIVEVAVDKVGSLNAGNRNQAVFLFVLTGASLTFAVDELFTYQTTFGTEDIGWAPLDQQTAGVITPIIFTTTMPICSFAFGTASDRVRVRVQGAGTLDIYLSTSLVV